MKLIRPHLYFIFWVILLFTMNRSGYLNEINHLVNSATSHFYTSLNSPKLSSEPPAVILFDDATAKHYQHPIMIPRSALAELLNRIPTKKFRRIGIDIDLSVNASGRRSGEVTADDIALIDAMKRHTKAGTEVFAVRNPIPANDSIGIPSSPLDKFYKITPNFLWVQANYQLETGSGFSEAQLTSKIETDDQQLILLHWGLAQSTSVPFPQIKESPDSVINQTPAFSAILRFASFYEADSARYFSRHSWLDVIDHGLRGTRGDQIIVAGSHQLSNDWHSTFLNPKQEPGIILNLNAATTLESTGPLQAHGLAAELSLLTISLVIFISLTPNSALSLRPITVAAIRTLSLTTFLLAINYLSIHDGFYFSAVFSILSVEYIRTGNLFILRGVKKIRVRRLV